MTKLTRRSIIIKPIRQDIRKDSGNPYSGVIIVFPHNTIWMFESVSEGEGCSVDDDVKLLLALVKQDALEGHEGPLHRLRQVEQCRGVLLEPGEKQPWM